ncbi:MAG TPA: beta-ketoacyl-ACP synthase III [Symbiobacteriaceae bacterium]|jgi:3-oxoacyl-[acyl-carrier-protein] synthase-3|nr:beta-ketoacyl-ACP synthase III [Symbiobacteriaceae bacterium]
MRFGATIAGVGSYVPEQRLSNEDLAALVETTDEWIVSRTGIRERRIALPSEGASQLALRAAQAALAESGIDPAALDLILVATATPDLVFPPVACLVQAGLGAGRAAAFDLNGVCSGFLSALITGAQFIQSGAYRNVLVIGADTFSRLMDYTDRTTCILFGDGAGAAVLTRTAPEFGLIDFELKADGSRAGLIHCPLPGSPAATLAQIGAVPGQHFRQDGRTVFKLAVTGMAEAVQTVLDRQGLTPQDLRVLVPHQANQRILSAVAERVGLPEERVAVCIEEYGNTSAATIPLALHAWLKQGNALQDGDYVMLTAFAGGLLWGAALLRWGRL